MMTDTNILGLKIGLYLIEERAAAEKAFFSGGYMPDKPNQNVSHSSGMLALCQHTSKAVGIDLEIAPAPTDYMAVAKDFFWPEEITFLHNVDNHPQQAGFFLALWTAKEAHCKLLRSSIYDELPGPNLTAWLVGGCQSKYRFTDKNRETQLLFKTGSVDDKTYYLSICL